MFYIWKKKKERCINSELLEDMCKMRLTANILEIDLFTTFFIYKNLLFTTHGKSQGLLCHVLYSINVHLPE